MVDNIEPICNLYLIIEEGHVKHSIGTSHEDALYNLYWSDDVVKSRPTVILIKENVTKEDVKKFRRTGYSNSWSWEEL